MLYQLYQAQADLMLPLRTLARYGEGIARAWDLNGYTPPALRHFGAACGLIADSAMTHKRPPFGIETVRMGDDLVGVEEVIADDTPFASLLRFRDGAIGKCSVSIECRQPYHFPLVLQGDKGSVVDDRLSTLDHPGTAKLKKWATLPTAMPDSGDVNDHPYLGQLEYFVDCIRKGTRPHNDLASTAHVHEVMFAVQEAIRTHKAVKVQKTPGCTTLFE